MTELFGLPGWLVEILVAAVGWLAATLLAGKILGLFLRRFEKSANQNFSEGGLQNGGYWIGIGERTLIYFFVLSGCSE